ncbi:hypothetical protein ACSVDE_00695 [Pseudalkalibacillus sp. Hm43]
MLLDVSGSNNIDHSSSRCLTLSVPGTDYDSAAGKDSLSVPGTEEVMMEY